MLGLTILSLLRMHLIQTGCWERVVKGILGIQTCFFFYKITMLRTIFAESIFSGVIQNRYLAIQNRYLVSQNWYLVSQNLHLVSQNRHARGPAKGNGSG